MQIAPHEVLRFYRQHFQQIIPTLSDWAPQEGVYWLPLTPYLGLCGTFDLEKIQVEFCRGLSGDLVTKVEHPIFEAFNAKLAASFIKEVCTHIQADLKQILSLFGSDIPLDIKFDPQIFSGIQVLSRDPVNPLKTQMVSRLPDQLYSSRTDFVDDPRVFVYGGLTLFLYEDEKEATDLLLSILIGNESRKTPLKNAIYHLDDQDSPQILGEIRSNGLGVSSLDRCKFRTVSSLTSLEAYAQAHQLVVVHLKDLVGTSLFDSHYRELCGEEKEDKNPLFYFQLSRYQGSIDDAIKSITALDPEAFSQVAHIFRVADGFLHLAYSDPRMASDKVPTKPKILIPRI